MSKYEHVGVGLWPEECGVHLLVQLQVVPNHLLWVYVPTGLGGLILTYLLFVARLVPRPIAALAPETTVYVSGLSKSVATGLRVGFVSAPPSRVSAIERAISLYAEKFGAA